MSPSGEDERTEAIRKGMCVYLVYLGFATAALMVALGFSEEPRRAAASSSLFVYYVQAQSLFVMIVWPALVPEFAKRRNETVIFPACLFCLLVTFPLSITCAGFSGTGVREWVQGHFHLFALWIFVSALFTLASKRNLRFVSWCYAGLLVPALVFPVLLGEFALAQSILFGISGLVLAGAVPLLDPNRPLDVGNPEGPAYHDGPQFFEAIPDVLPGSPARKDHDPRPVA